MKEFDLNKAQNYWFRAISQIPHPSRHEKQISDFIVDFAKKRNLYYKQDEVFNVIVEKEATPGYESAAPLILQAHIDMVPAKINGSNHIFETDPLKLYVDAEGWLHADGTTLGADDGVGVACMLAILDDDTLEHPYLQCYFTTMEEIGLLGAMELKKEDVKGSRMINLDGGGENVTVVSSAGGCNVYVHQKKEKVRNDSPTYRIHVSGLSGGHSAGNIHLEKGNAIVIATRLIKEMEAKGIGTKLVSLEGGEKDNAIPREATLVFASDAEKNAIQESVRKSEEEIFTELEFSDREVKIALEETETAAEVLENAPILDFIYLMPNGFQHRSMALEGLTQTSLNLGVAEDKEEEILLDILIRSSVQSALDDLVLRLRKLSKVLNVDLQRGMSYAGWNYEAESGLREHFKEVLKKHERELVEVATHGGLECGVFKALNPKMDIMSLGPNAYGCHTPEEKLDLDSFDFFYGLLKELVSSCKD